VPRCGICSTGSITNPDGGPAPGVPLDTASACLKRNRDRVTTSCGSWDRIDQTSTNIHCGRLRTPTGAPTATALTQPHRSGFHQRKGDHITDWGLFGWATWSQPVDLRNNPDPPGWRQSPPSSGLCLEEVFVNALGSRSAGEPDAPAGPPSRRRLVEGIAIQLAEALAVFRARTT